MSNRLSFTFGRFIIFFSIMECWSVTTTANDVNNILAPGGQTLKPEVEEIIKARVDELVTAKLDEFLREFREEKSKKEEADHLQQTITEIKRKGRGIWIAITSANMEREPLNLPKIWPLDLENDDRTAKYTVDTKSYFSYLLSNGDGIPVKEAAERVVCDLSPEALFENGLFIWKVCKIGNNSRPDAPFLVTSNISINGETIESSSDNGKVQISLNDVPPLGNKMVVWVTRGGGVFSSSAEDFDYTTFLGENEVFVMRGVEKRH